MDNSHFSIVCSTKDKVNLIPRALPSFYPVHSHKVILCLDKPFTKHVVNIIKKLAEAHDSEDMTRMIKLKNVFKINVKDRHFGLKQVKLSLFQRISLMLRGKVYLFHAKKQGWKGELPFYLARCKKHRIFCIDYPHSWDECFDCPLCLEENRYVNQRRV